MAFIKKFYVTDAHFGNTKIIDIENTTFASFDEMDEAIDGLAPKTTRQVLRYALTNSTGKKKLPQLVQRQLDLMFELKHPASLMLQDWLEGNRRFLSDDITSMAKPFPHSEGGQS